jgi:Family of unknown function (DUF6166)
MNLNSKLYHGKHRDTPGPTVVVDSREGYGLILRYHTIAPMFKWGAGATSIELDLLALAILTDVVGGEVSPELVVEFAQEVVAEFPEEGFTLADWQVESWLEARAARS